MFLPDGFRARAWPSRTPRDLRVVRRRGREAAAPDRVSEGRPAGPVELLVEPGCPARREGQKRPSRAWKSAGRLAAERPGRCRPTGGQGRPARPEGPGESATGRLRPWLSPPSARPCESPSAPRSPTTPARSCFPPRSRRSSAPRSPNVRVTQPGPWKRTVLLDFNVSKAGVRELVFPSCRSCRRARSGDQRAELRQKTRHSRPSGGPPGMVACAWSFRRKDRAGPRPGAETTGLLGARQGLEGRLIPGGSRRAAWSGSS